MREKFTTSMVDLIILLNLWLSIIYSDLIILFI